MSATRSRRCPPCVVCLYIHLRLFFSLFTGFFYNPIPLFVFLEIHVGSIPKDSVCSGLLGFWALWSVVSEENFATNLSAMS
jgi:hypothetical protein